MSKKYPFSSLWVVMLAPEERGVYLLYDDDGRVIYIGRAAGVTVTIQSRLLSHLRGHEGACTQNASEFSFEVTEYPVTREAELLALYKGLDGDLPDCNDRIG